MGMNRSLRPVLFEPVRQLGPRRCAILLFSVLLVLHPPARAALIIVEGDCTLVDAINAANSDAPAGGCPAGSGADVLRLTAQVLLTEVDNEIDGPNGTPSITSEILIAGQGFPVSRAGGCCDYPEFRIFHVAPQGNLGLHDLTVTGGRITRPAKTLWGGGILNRGILTLRNTSVSRNFAGDLDYPTDWRGGGISNAGSMTLVDSSISGNTMDNGRGAGIHNVGSAVLLRTAVSDNRLSFMGNVGVGIHNQALSKSLILIDSTITGNEGNSFSYTIAGGGLFDEEGNAILINTTVADNLATEGGGIFGASTLIGSTVTGNRATYGGGGGISGRAILISSTVSGNTSQVDPGYGCFPDCVGGIDGPATVINSIVTGNAGSDVGGITGAAHVVNSIIADNLRCTEARNGRRVGGCITHNCRALGSDDGGNFADDASCGPGFTPIIPGVDFDTELADNGGPTETHALLSGSVAIDAAGDCGYVRDQRGFLRDGPCDSGSFEFGAIPPPPPPAITLSGSCPGQVTVQLSGLTPGGAARLALAEDRGAFVQVAGRCAGLALGLDDPRPRGRTVADANGEAVVVADFPLEACGGFVQAVDSATCSPSNVRQIP